MYARERKKIDQPYHPAFHRSNQVFCPQVLEDKLRLLRVPMSS